MGALNANSLIRIKKLKYNVKEQSARVKNQDKSIIVCTKLG